MKFFQVYYDYTDNRCQRQQGTFYTPDLCDVFAFANMVDRYLGWCKCNLHDLLEI
jgi:hypothetical protein